MSDAVRAAAADFIIPGVGDTIDAALTALEDLCTDMKEGQELYGQLIQRMRALYDKMLKTQDADLLFRSEVLPQFGTEISKLQQFMLENKNKHALARLLAGHKVEQAILKFHMKIDLLHQLLNQTHIVESAVWRAKYNENECVHHERLNVIVSQTQNIIFEIRGRTLVEVLTEMKYVIDGNDAQLPNEYSAEHIALIRKTFQSVIRTSRSRVRAIPSWYFPRDHVNYEETPFDIGPDGTVHMGKWKGLNVVVKCLYMDTFELERTFWAEANIWSNLNHPYVLRLLGACHVSSPMFFVSEYCTNGNFVTYFERPKNRRYLWTRFHEAARGLDYLHSEKVSHGNLRCNNILVGNDGNAKICDFQSLLSQAKYDLPLNSHRQIRWDALESYEGLNENDLIWQFKSDVYSLGMCIIEAVSGGVPWGMMSDDEILDSLYDGNAHPRTPGFTDKEWEFVQAITRVDYEERESLDYAIKMLTELADGEKQQQQQQQFCRICDNISDISFKFCSECGGKFEARGFENFSGECGGKLEARDFEHFSDRFGKVIFQQTGKSCTHCGELNPTASRVCCDCGTLLPQISERAPSRKKCSCCGDLNRIENRFCCQCGVDIEVIRRNRL